MFGLKIRVAGNGAVFFSTGKTYGVQYDLNSLKLNVSFYGVNYTLLKSRGAVGK